MLADIVSKTKRSEMMAGIKGRNTKPELVLRSLLHRHGYRFRLYGKSLPGKPDVVLSKWKTVIFVHGCFWHGHTNCELYRLPKSRTDFWTEKISTNRIRDTKQTIELVDLGWNVIVVWECSLVKKRRLNESVLIKTLESTLKSENSYEEISAPKT